MAGTNLTADANFVSKGEYRIQYYPLASAVTPFVGGFAYLDSSGNLNPIPINTGADNSALRVIGQICAANTAILASESGVAVRFNGVFEANILSGQTMVPGALCYLTSDNQLTTVSTNNPKAGIYIGASPTGNGLVYQTITIPA